MRDLDTIMGKARYFGEKTKLLGGVHGANGLRNLYIQHRLELRSKSALGAHGAVLNLFLKVTSDTGWEKNTYRSGSYHLTQRFTAKTNFRSNDKELFRAEQIHIETNDVRRKLSDFC